MRDRSLSKVTPRLRTVDEGSMLVFWKVMVEDDSLERCCDVPMIKYSVFEGLTVRRLDVSQL